MATVLTSACADLVTENIQPILNQPNISQVREKSEHAQAVFIWLFSLAVVTFVFDSPVFHWGYNSRYGS